MLRSIASLTSDLHSVVNAFILAILLFVGAVACVAVATLVSHTILLRPEEGIETFFAVLSFSNAGLIEPVRQGVEILNWVGLLAIGLVSCNSCASYLRGVPRRAAPSSNVVRFPRKMIVSEQTAKKAAN